MFCLNKDKNRYILLLYNILDRKLDFQQKNSFSYLNLDLLKLKPLQIDYKNEYVFIYIYILLKQVIYKYSCILLLYFILSKKKIFLFKFFITNIKNL